MTASKDTKQNKKEGKKSLLGRLTIPLGSGDDLNNSWEGDWGKPEREETEGEKKGR